MILPYGLLNSSHCNDLECPWRSFAYCKPFQVRNPSASAELLVNLLVTQSNIWYSFVSSTAKRLVRVCEGISQVELVTRRSYLPSAERREMRVGNEASVSIYGQLNHVTAAWCSDCSVINGPGDVRCSHCVRANVEWPGRVDWKYRTGYWPTEFV